MVFRENLSHNQNLSHTPFHDKFPECQSDVIQHQITRQSKAETFSPIFGFLPLRKVQNRAHRWGECTQKISWLKTPPQNQIRVSKHPQIFPKNPNWESTTRFNRWLQYEQCLFCKLQLGVWRCRLQFFTWAYDVGFKPWLQRALRELSSRSVGTFGYISCQCHPYRFPIAKRQKKKNPVFSFSPPLRLLPLIRLSQSQRQR